MSAQKVIHKIWGLSASKQKFSILAFSEKKKYKSKSQRDHLLLTYSFGGPSDTDRQIFLNPQKGDYVKRSQFS